MKICSFIIVRFYLGSQKFLIEDGFAIKFSFNTIVAFLKFVGKIEQLVRKRSQKNN